MSETERSKSKESPSASTGTTTTAGASSSLYSTTATTSKVSSSNGRSSGSTSSAYTQRSSTSSAGFGSSSFSSTTKLPSKPPPPLPAHSLKRLLPPAPSSRSRSNYNSASAIRKAFLNYMKDPECLDKAADYLYESLLEDAVMGIYLEVHHSIKSGSMEAIEGQSEDDTAFKIVDTPNYDVFGQSKSRKPMDCNCPNCDRLVGVSRFAPHLEKCMGMGRKTSRTASRRLANAKEGNSSYFSANVSDDEDDVDWSAEKRRKKIQSSRSNGSKRNGKSS